MLVNKNQFKHHIFIGGVNPQATSDNIKSTLSQFGVVDQVVLKSRGGSSELNLGYGILSTNSTSLNAKLLKMKFFSSEYGRVEFQQYMEREEASKKKMIQKLNREVYLTGLGNFIDAKDLKILLWESIPGLKIENVILKRSHVKQSMTGDARIILKHSGNLKKVQSLFPLNYRGCNIQVCQKKFTQKKAEKVNNSKNKSTPKNQRNRVKLSSFDTLMKSGNSLSTISEQSNHLDSESSHKLGQTNTLQMLKEGLNNAPYAAPSLNYHSNYQFNKVKSQKNYNVFEKNTQKF